VDQGRYEEALKFIDKGITNCIGVGGYEGNRLQIALLAARSECLCKEQKFAEADSDLKKAFELINHGYKHCEWNVLRCRIELNMAKRDWQAAETDLNHLTASWNDIVYDARLWMASNFGTPLGLSDAFDDLLFSLKAVKVQEKDDIVGKIRLLYILSALYDQHYQDKKRSECIHLADALLKRVKDSSIRQEIESKTESLRPRHSN
jgi:hypothetical protein